MADKVKKNYMDSKFVLFIGTLSVTAILLTVLVLSSLGTFFNSSRKYIYESGSAICAENAKVIETYLQVGIDAVSIAAACTDQMLSDGDDNELIVRFLEAQSQAIALTSEGMTEGLYAYVNGRYLDGTSWTPPEGYDPQSRIWYTEAIAAAGELVISSPYLDDFYSNEYTVTVCKMLSDGHSVVALDMKLDKIQEIAETTNINGIGIGLVVDADRNIVAHSEKGRIGSSIAYEGSEIVLEMNSTEDGPVVSSKTELEINDKRYICFSESVADCWNYIIIVSKDELLYDIRLTLFRNIGLVFIVYGLVAYFCTLAFKSRLKEKESRTEAEKMSDKLLETLKEAESANKSKSRFLFSMSHDIRTPMNAVLNYTDLALKHVEEADVARDYLQKSQASSKHLMRILDDVLDMSRIESGNVEMIEEDVDLSENVDQIITMFEESAKAKQLELVAKKNLINSYVHMDMLHCSRIAINIISNAIKYTPPGGSVVVDISQEECGPDDPEHLKTTLTVSDNGIGMSEEFLAHIYDTFSREKTTSQSGINGTGLGMAIAKQLADKMNVSIDVQSKPGEGTVVKVSGIARTVSSIKASAEERRACGTTLSLENTVVLVAEDNEMNREIVGLILKEIGVKVEFAEDGKEAVEMVSKAGAGYYDLVLMDIQMPNMDGYSATRAIRNMADICLRNIPIVAMTANAFEEDKKVAYGCGMNGHLAKPIDVKELKKVLNLYARHL